MRITQLTYDEFKENIDELISQYRENFSVPVVTDWKEYEYLYRSRCAVYRGLRQTAK